MTASFGIASLRPNEGLAAALVRADVALCRSKNEGQDRITAKLPDFAPHTGF
ncbi:hypothetical protein [Falsirhodobacter deserti]|uniref:hypothetical protein n=1 Tax=Falsirhodobacter deserti TaxID=1365611 RepID=UPI0013E356CC|nr:hypothetical protein [Falsirhodobacter deserti]